MANHTCRCWNELRLTPRGLGLLLGGDESKASWSEFSVGSRPVIKGADLVFPDNRKGLVKAIEAHFLGGTSESVVRHASSGAWWQRAGARGWLGMAGLLLKGNAPEWNGSAGTDKTLLVYDQCCRIPKLNNPPAGKVAGFFPK